MPQAMLAHAYSDPAAIARVWRGIAAWASSWAREPVPRSGAWDWSGGEGEVAHAAPRQAAGASDKLPARRHSNVMGEAKASPTLGPKA
jgi:hypothetical protein